MSGLWRRRRGKKRNGEGENFVFVKQDHSPVVEAPQKRRAVKKNGGFLGLGLLCGSFEQVTLCRDIFCGGENDEDLIGRVIGDPDDPRVGVSPNRSYDGRSTEDHDDPRY